MRVALVIGSAYEKNGQVTPVPAADLDCELVERRLSDQDAGFHVLRFEAERGLAERIEQRLLAQSQPIEEILLYFSGYCVLSAERGPALLLDGDRLGTFSIPRMRKLLEYFAPSSCVLMDAAAVVDEDQTLESVVNALGRALAVGSMRVNVLLAARRSDAPDSYGGSAFTGLVLRVLDWLAASRSEMQPVDLAWLHEGLLADQQSFSVIPAAMFFPQPHRFVILPGVAALPETGELPRFADADPPEQEDFDEETLPFTARDPDALPSFASIEPEPLTLPDSGQLEPLPSFSDSDPEPATDPQQSPEPIPRTWTSSPPREDDVLSSLLDAELAAPAPSPTELPSFAPSAAVADELFAAGEFERAGDEYRAVLESVTEAAERARLLARQARAWIRIGRTEEALRLLDQASFYDSNDSDVIAVRTELTQGSQQVSTRLPSDFQAQESDRARPAAAKAAVSYLDISEYERALASSRDPQEIARIAAALDDLSRRATLDPIRVAAALEYVVPLNPADLALCDRLVALYRDSNQAERGLNHCRRAARIAPTRAGTYRSALALFEMLGALDGAWNAASVLDCLGEADINEALLASQHKPEGLLAARGTVAYSEWQSVLLAGDLDAKIWDVLEALGPAGVRAGIGFAKHQRRYSEPDPACVQDPDKSTTMLAKTMGWTTRLFGLAPPALYVVPEVAGELDVGTTEQPSALASRTLASGLGLNQLAFLWGRQVPRFRNELRALGFFRSVPELTLLVTAALALGDSADFVRRLDGDAKRIYAGLRRDVRGTALDRLKAVARGFPSAEVVPRIERTLRGAELAGVRAGLIACGDVSLAAQLLRQYPFLGLTNPDEQLAELYAFSISEAYAGLRQRIGVSVAA